MESILTDGDSVDINGVELTEEISAVSPLLGKRKPNQCTKINNNVKFCPKP